MKRIDKYEIKHEIGRGGGGTVYLAFDPALKRDVAIKVINTMYQSTPDFTRRFLQEARVAAALSHPNLTTIYDMGKNLDGNPYIVMEYLEGADLRTMLLQKNLSVIEKLQIAKQISAGLAVIHDQQIVHRDIKPGNIFIKNDGMVKIMDFGIAKLLDTESMHTVTNGTIGTVGYMSPEQISGKRIDTRSDIFSFGVVLYELFTGQRPFQGNAITDVINKVLTIDPKPFESTRLSNANALQALILSCLAKEPQSRYSTISKLASDIDDCIRMYSDLTVKADPGGTQSKLNTDESTAIQSPLSERHYELWSPQATTVNDHKSEKVRILLPALLSLFLFTALGVALFPFNPPKAIEKPADMVVTSGNTPRILMERENRRARRAKASKYAANLLKQAKGEADEAAKMMTNGHPKKAGEHYRKAQELFSQAADLSQQAVVEKLKVTQPKTRQKTRNVSNTAASGKRKNRQKKSPDALQAPKGKSKTPIKLSKTIAALREQILSDHSRDFAREAFRAAELSVSKATTLRKQGLSEKANESEQLAIALYQRVLSESEMITQAMLFYAAAEYDSALTLLSRVIETNLYSEKNQTALDLHKDAQESQSFLDGILFSAENAIKKDNLKTAEDILINLSEIERSSSKVKALRDQIRQDDSQEPVIIHHPHDSYSEEDLLVISTTASDNLGVESIQLYYRLEDDSAYRMLDLKLVNGSKDSGVFAGALEPDEHQGSAIYYFFEAQDFSGNVVKQQSETQQPFKIRKR